MVYLPRAALAEALAPYATATTAEGEGDITLSTDTASLADILFWKK